MIQEFASDWLFRLHALLDFINIFPAVQNSWSREAINMHHAYRRNTVDMLLGYLVLLWSLLYVIYEQCLHSLLRRMHLPLMQRVRIINAVWSCGFCFGSICYFLSSRSQSFKFSSYGWEISHWELGVALHKSFYFHCAMINILYHKAWIKGLANILFLSFVFTADGQKRCGKISAFLIYKASDIILLNICCIIVCFSKNIGKKISVYLFLLHCFNWVYLYMYFVPKTILYSDKTSFIQVDLGLWLWFATECLDSVLLKLLMTVNTNYWLEICLFPRPTKEAIQLATIWKKYQKTLKKTSSLKTPKSAELWQTLLCAMAVKKKIKRLREAKQYESKVVNNSEPN